MFEIGKRKYIALHEYSAPKNIHVSAKKLKARNIFYFNLIPWWGWLLPAPPAYVLASLRFLKYQFRIGKVTSVQEVCVKCFAIYLSKFKIWQITWKNRKKKSGNAEFIIVCQNRSVFLNINPNYIFLVFVCIAWFFI